MNTTPNDRRNNVIESLIAEINNLLSKLRGVKEQEERKLLVDEIRKKLTELENL